MTEAATDWRAQLTAEQQAQVNDAGEPARSTRFLMSHFPELTFEQAFAKSIANYHCHREEWLVRSVDPYARKHGLTRHQALSVLFCDNTPGKHAREVACPAGEMYAAYTFRADGLQPFTALGVQPLKKGDRVQFARDYVSSLGDKAGNLGTLRGTVEGPGQSYSLDASVAVRWDHGPLADQKSAFLERVLS